MRILVVHPGPDFSVHDLYTGWTEALRGLGVEVAGYNANDRLAFYSRAYLATGEKDQNGNPVLRQAMSSDADIVRAAMQGLTHACYTMWPDVVVFISAFYVPPAILELIRSRRHKIVLIHTESPYQDTEQLARAPFADLNLLNDPVNIESYRDLGVPAEYMPHAYRPQVHHPRPAGISRDPQLACDLAFVGTGYESRISFFEAMDLTGLDVILGGNWQDLPATSPLLKHLQHDQSECVSNEETASLYRNARAGINLYRREGEDEHAGEGWALGPREVEMAATGLFFLRDPRGEGDEVLPMLPAFASPADASAQLRWWLEHDRQREKAAAAAREAVAERTFANNARRLLNLLNTEVRR